MEKRYEVQTWTLCDGWINTWSITEEVEEYIFTEVPETFATRKEAQQALDEFLADIQEEIDAGQRAEGDARGHAHSQAADIDLVGGATEHRRVEVAEDRDHGASAEVARRCHRVAQPRQLQHVPRDRRAHHEVDAAAVDLHLAFA